MNDRYLYRAKRTDNGEWVEGNIMTCNDRCFIVPKFGISCIEEHKNLMGDNMISLYAFEVDQSTICQCTGLEDKNGKLIWENDIVKHFYIKEEPDRYDIGVVQWDDVHLRFKRTSKTDEKCVGISFYSVYEVIGSAIDNPELLE